MRLTFKVILKKRSLGAISENLKHVVRSLIRLVIGMSFLIKKLNRKHWCFWEPTHWKPFISFVKACLRRDLESYIWSFNWIFQAQEVVLSDLKGRIRNYHPGFEAGCRDRRTARYACWTSGCKLYPWLSRTGNFSVRRSLAGCVCEQLKLNITYVIFSIIALTVSIIFTALICRICSSPLILTS